MSLEEYFHVFESILYAAIVTQLLAGRLYYVFEADLVECRYLDGV